MDAVPRELRVYEESPGQVPFLRCLKGLADFRVRKAIQVRLDRLEAGNFGDNKSVGGGVRELRIDVGAGFRVYFAEDGPRIVLLLIGGDKKSQVRDIQTARHYWDDYKRRAQ